MSVRRCQQEISNTEFLDWCFYLKSNGGNRLGKHEKIEYYLAQVAHSIYMSVSGPKSKKLKLTDFLLDFGNKDIITHNVPSKKENESKKKMTQKDAAKLAKARWAAFLSRKE